MIDVRLERLIPDNATEVATVTNIARFKAVVYVWTDVRKGVEVFLAKAFTGRKKKPYFFYRYSTVEARQESINQFIGYQQKEANEAQQRKDVVDNFERDVVVGDILHSSWGYEQTNCDWYQVTELVGKKSVKLREIGANLTYDHSMSGKSSPVPNQYIGAEQTKKYGYYGAKLSSFETARKWDGKSKYWSSYA